MLPTLLIAIDGLAIIVIAAIGGQAPAHISHKQRLLLVGIALATTIGIVTGQFITATEPGSSSIIEAQGRYFIPLLGLGACLFATNWVRNRVFALVANLSAALLAVASLLLTLFFLVKRYYLP